MKFIQKILFVAIFGWCIGSVEGMGPPPAAALPILDLPIGVNGTPGLVAGAGNPIFIQKTVNGVLNVNCLHVIVPNTPAHAARVAPGGSIAAARAADGNIYFPRSGVQPTTEEAVEYSCANIDNREDSPITEWYMKMFGVIDKNGGNSDNNDDYIKAGWTNDYVNKDPIPSECRIITIDKSEFLTPQNFESKFQDTFRVIASNPVGRVLLYRMLIEIRRHGNSNFAGTTAEIIRTNWQNRDNNLSNQDVKRLIRKRNKYRRFIIKFGSKDLCRGNQIIFNHNLRLSPSIVNPIEDQIRYTIAMYECDNLQRFFHELIHQFHKLVDINRHDKEKRVKIFDFWNPSNFSIYFWNQYFSGCFQVTSISLLPWSYWIYDNLQEQNFSNGNTECKVEEIRTICGSVEKEYFQKILGFPTNYEYWNGDDISENLFLLSMGKPLRFGHEKVPFIEEGKVINNFLCALSAAASKFRINFSPTLIENVSNPPNTDKLKDYFWGWGNFVIFRKDCEYKTNEKWDDVH